MVETTFEAGGPDKCQWEPLVFVSRPSIYGRGAVRVAESSVSHTSHRPVAQFLQGLQALKLFKCKFNPTIVYDML